MICYARQFGRNDEHHRKNLYREILDLNNRVIIMLPPEEILAKRLSERGDEFQNPSSVIALRNIFAEEAEKLRNFPNILIVEKAPGRDELVNLCVKWLESKEVCDPVEAGRAVRDATVAALNPLRRDTTCKLHVTFSKEDSFSSIANHPREGDYYRKIISDVLEIFRAEFAGENEYGKIQDLSSRRFYYSSSSCVSSVHFLVRNGWFNVFAQLRSTDVHRNASIDTKFLCHLCELVAKHYNLPVKNVSLDIRYNCAHERHDLPPWNKNEEIE
tara:strand:+ start:5652 stop:6467 length:816 start_codon:yes stop_codon:yes gene_type:complete